MQEVRMKGCRCINNFQGNTVYGNYACCPVHGVNTGSDIIDMPAQFASIIKIAELTFEVINKAMAEFLDLIPIDAGTKSMGEIKYPEIPVPFLKYESNWNELHLVIERIESLGYKFQLCKRTAIIIEDFEPYNVLFDIKLDNKHMSAYHAAYRFLLYYNSRKAIEKFMSCE